MDSIASNLVAVFQIVAFDFLADVSMSVVALRIWALAAFVGSQICELKFGGEHTHVSLFMFTHILAARPLTHDLICRYFSGLLCLNQ